MHTNGNLDGENVDSEHMIIRFPIHIADSINKDIENGAKLEKKLSIKFNKDARNCIIRYNNMKINALILNLPNEACTMKTTNSESFTNLLPIKHMIVAEEDSKTKYNKDFTLKHGVTAPLKNINILKYRKPKKKQSVKMAQIIKDMLNADTKADAVWYKMVDESDDEQTELKDIEYIRAETQRIDYEKQRAKEAKEAKDKLQFQQSSSDCSHDYNDDSSIYSSGESHLSLTDYDSDDQEGEQWTDDDDFEDY